MIVRQSTYDAMERKYRDSVRKHNCTIDRYNALVKEHNELVRLINSKGGQEFLDKATIHGNAYVSKQFTDDELRSLLQLVHPDKHGGKQSAVTMTVKINSLRAK